MSLTETACSECLCIYVDRDSINECSGFLSAYASPYSTKPINDFVNDMPKAFHYALAVILFNYFIMVETAFEDPVLVSLMHVN